MHLWVRSPVAVQGDGEPCIQEWEHIVDIVLPDTWPAGRPLVLHRSPHGALHPNIFYPNSEDPGDRLLARAGALARGAVCYADHASPQMRLLDLAEQLWNMLGLRFDRYAMDDALSLRAVTWLQRVLSESPELIPTERRPLVDRQAPVVGGP
jgi:hypothetical protein